MARLSAPIVLRATFEHVWWEDGAEDPCEERGYTDPRNPWGGIDAIVPDGLCGAPFAAWRDKNAETVTFQPDEFAECVDFVADFPGGVWNAETECEAEQNVRDGTWRRVWLHVDGKPADIAAIIERAFD